jgi:hypothetical protein
MPQVPGPARKERTRLLRELGAQKNLAFRRSQQGRTVSAVALHNGTALTTNYLSVELATPRAPGQLTTLTLGDLTEHGLAEATPFPVLAS